MITRIVLAMILNLSFIASSFAGTIPYRGVWAGSIGAHMIRVCFTTADDSQYYYAKHLQDMPLKAANPNEINGTESVSEWKEIVSVEGENEKISGIWKFNKVTESSLSGEWYKPHSSKKLEIRLNKVAELKGQLCGTAYDYPMETLASDRTKGWDIYFLPRSYRGASRFNAYVRSWLQEKVGHASECQSNYGYELEFSLVKKVLTNAVLVVHEGLYSDSCGDVHGTASSSYLTFDPETGKQLDSWIWIKSGNKAVSTNPATHLRALIDDLNPAKAENEECQDAFSVEQPYPTKDGFVFPTYNGWGSRACDREVLVPYNKLRPYLTAAGKAIAKSFGY